MLQFFDILEEEYSGSDLIDFEVLEELSSSSESAGYGINSDTASFTLYNKERKFDKGYLRSLLLLNRKVIPYIGIERDGEIDYTKLGTFYSNEWTVPQTDITVKLKCVDKLMSLQLVTYIGFPFTAGTNLYAIGVYIPLLVDFSKTQILLFLSVFAVMTILWCFVSACLIGIPSIKNKLQRYKNILVPVIFVSLGIYILLKNHCAV